MKFCYWPNTYFPPKFANKFFKNPTMWFSGFSFLILSLIVEVYLWWKLQASLIFLSGRTCTIGSWLNTFLPHCKCIIHSFIHSFIHSSACMEHPPPFGRWWICMYGGRWNASEEPPDHIHNSLINIPHNTDSKRRPQRESQTNLRDKSLSFQRELGVRISWL